MDNTRWNAVRMENISGGADFYLNGKQVYTCSLEGAVRIVIKAQRGLTTIRRLEAFGYDPGRNGLAREDG